MSAQPRVLLGEIIGVHGIKGDVVIRSYTANPEAIASYGRLSDAAGTRSYDISPIRSGPKGVVARIAGIDDRTTAEKLRGTKLYIDRNALPPPETGAFYFTDLIGLKAIDLEQKAFGKIVAVHNYGAGDMIEVQIDGQSASELIPFSDAFVPKVDVQGGSVVVIVPVPEDGDGEEPPLDEPSDEKGE